MPFHLTDDRKGINTALTGLRYIRAQLNDLRLLLLFHFRFLFCFHHCFLLHQCAKFILG